MKIHFRKMLTVMLFITVTGALMSGCGLRYVLNTTRGLDRDDALEFNIAKTEVEPITKIAIHTGMAEVELIPADKFYVEIDYLYWDEKPEYTLENGELSFDDRDSFPDSYSINFNLDNSIKIYLPQDSALNSITIEDASGDVTVAGFIAEELDVTVSYGDFTMKEAAGLNTEITLSSGSSRITDFQAGEFDFTNSYGNARFTDINTTALRLPADTLFEQFNVTMSSGEVDISGLHCNVIDINDSYGDVTIENVISDDMELKLSSGNLEISHADVASVDASNSYGNVTLQMLGASTDYALDLDTSYGKINVGEQSYEEHLIVDNDGTRDIKTELSSGDVKVSFVSE